MKRLSWSVARNIPATFLLTGAVSLTLLLGSVQLGLAQSPIGANVQFWSGSATSISTANCSGAGGLCQPAPACNNGAGPNPDTISASVTLCEVSVSTTIGPPLTLPNPSQKSGTLTGSGTGTGFRPGVTYISLIYKNPNPATCSRFPQGVPATLQNLAQADSDFASMFLGFWVRDPEPNPTGHATLMVDKQATVLGLNNYTTVSVREMQPPNANCFDCGNDPAPQLNALRACGTLAVTPTTSCTLP